MSIKVLFDDRNRSKQVMYRSILEKETDMEVLACIDRHGISSQIETGIPPDVLILDANSGSLLTLNEIHRLKSFYPEIKILVISFYSDSRYVVRMFQAGASGYLLADCSYEELPVAVRSVAANRIYVSPGIAGIVENKKNERQ